MHSLPIGEEASHNFTILQGSCRALSSSVSFPEDKVVYTEFQELRGESVNVRGRMNVTMKNGDMVYYAYDGSFAADITKPFL